MKKWIAGSALSVALLATSAWASVPFDQCPAQAFLVQDLVARQYGVDLSTGYVELLADNLGTSGKLNGLGFNYGDAFLYGWSYEYRTMARVGSDYTVEPITLVSPIDDNYFVGDVAVDGSAYYVYKRGSGGSHGLWRIDLLPTSNTYLDPVRIINGQLLNLQIYDFAFHPTNGLLYSVTSAGGLVSIVPSTGATVSLGNVGESGVFGAVYFDVDGNLYISRNTDGSIFQIKIDAGSTQAEWYAQGPNSTQNDGARCALASVDPQVDSQIDFGDAPDSYGTTLDSNGARHNLEGSTLLLGSIVDSETQARVAPQSDEGTQQADEDGVQFITDLAANNTALIAIDTQGTGFLNAWIDLNRNGVFDTGEQVVDDHPVAGGSEILSIDLPRAVDSGMSWARFRVSSSQGIGPTGGVSDGEVEDYEVELFGRRVTTTHYPSASGFVTLAYEDLWPLQGDYDMNDLVIYYRTTLNTASYDLSPGESYIYSVSVTGQITAVGATLRSGFAVEIPGVPRSSIDQSAMSLVIGGVEQPTDFLEVGAGFENAVFIIFDDVWNYVTSSEGCTFYRTEDFCSGSSGQSIFTLTVPLKTDVLSSALDDIQLNPFIFGANARRVEIHLKNKPPTVKADTLAFGSGDDASDPGAGIYYQTATGLPWAIVIGDAWVHPEESRDISETYPGFEPYVTSGGGQNLDWHRSENAVAEKLYREQ